MISASAQFETSGWVSCGGLGCCDAQVFRFERGQRKVKRIDLQSFYFEAGEDSYMKEITALQV